MSQSVSQLSTASSVKGLWYGNAGKTEAGTSGVAAFDQTLISMMLQGGNSQDGQALLPLLSLSGLQEQQSVDNGQVSDEGLETLLAGLLEQLQQLDEKLQEDPTLLPILQGWLQEVSMIIPPLAVNEESGGDSTGAISILAQHPETVRFAVQDALMTLAPILRQSQIMTADQVQQSKALLEGLQNILGSIQKDPDLVKAANSLLTANKTTDTSGLTQGTNDGAKVTAVPQDDVKALDQKNNAVSQQKANEFQLKSGTTSSVNASIVQDVNSVETPQEDNLFQSGQIVTAGQLAMREMGTSSVKLQAQPVPVENFGKEISGFLVSKMEIVKLHGMSEARISLYPEHLGQVDIKITMQGGQMMAQFVTEHAFAKESLEQQIAQLRAALQSQGVQVGKLEVSQNTGLSSHMYHDGHQSSHQGNQEQQNNKRRSTVKEDSLVINDLTDEWNEWISDVRAKELSLGSSFVAKA